MKILVVSDREYKKTSRGIDIITTYLAEKGHSVDHLVFFRRKRIPEKQISENIRQFYFYDSIKLYRGKLQFLFPGFLLIAYFRHIITRNSPVDFQQYDYIILESGHPMYLASVINNKIIYRQSDPTHICFNSNRTFYKRLETTVIQKSLLISSALEEIFFNPEYKDKFFHWHSGFIPCTKAANQNANASCIVMGGELDWHLISKMAKKHPQYRFNVIGIRGKRFTQKNIISMGYLGYENYQEVLSSALVTIIPFSNNYVRQLRQVSFTAKILVSMQLGMPILLRSYGTVNNTDCDKKLYVYNSHKEALALLDDMVKKIESGMFNREVSKETQDFLTPQTSENRLKELDEKLSPIFG